MGLDKIVSCQNTFEKVNLQNTIWFVQCKYFSLNRLNHILHCNAI